MNKAFARNFYSSPSSVGNKFRAKRIKPLTDAIKQIYQKKGGVSILDVGGKIRYWDIIDKDFLLYCKVKIVILNIPGENLDDDTEICTHTTGDACDMQYYNDNHFDIVHSNSVIEHVGNWSKMKSFASEVRRVGKYLFVQTPNFWFPIEPHYMTPFFHWLPRYTRISLILKHTLGNRGQADDLNDAMEKLEGQPRMINYACFCLLFPDCTIIKEKFLFVTKSFIALRMAQL